MNGLEKGKLRSQRWYAWIDRLPKRKREVALDSGPQVPCTIAPKNIPEEERWCWHLTCKIAAGVLPPIAEFNAQFRDQAYNNWLRFQDLHTIALAYWALKKHWQKTGEFQYHAAAIIGVSPSREE